MAGISTWQQSRLLSSCISRSNRAVGASFGESDLAPVLYWISLYRQWLEDRARLNYFRQMFSFVLTRPFTSQAEKDKYMRDFAYKLPKKSGGVLGLDPTETLEALNPQLASGEAETDGMALKRMIATGVGIPMHFFAEPESSTTHHRRGSRHAHLQTLRTPPAVHHQCCSPLADRGSRDPIEVHGQWSRTWR